MIRFTTSALKRLVDITSKHKSHVRFGVTSGGCAGLEYTWTYIIPEEFQVERQQTFSEYVLLDNDYGIGLSLWTPTLYNRYDS